MVAVASRPCFSGMIPGIPLTPPPLSLPDHNSVYTTSVFVGRSVGETRLARPGAAACNSLPDLYLRDPSRSADSFRRDLFFFLVLLAAHTDSALEASRLCAV